MKKQSNLLYAFVILVITLAGCNQKPEIDQAEVARIVTTLSADDMEGRRVFTPGIEKAAKFIQSEFEKIGLDYIDGLNSYEQKFSMYSLSPESVSVTLNGKSVDQNNIVASINGTEIEWTDIDDLTVITVGAEDDLRSIYNRERRSPGKKLILIDPAHQEMFSRYRSFFTRGNNVMELDTENGLVLVVSKSISLRSVNIKVKNAVVEKGLSNVVGKISGRRSNEIILFSGHYDHLGIRGTEGDTIYNGANDDASGVTAVITLAKYFKDMGVKPERTIMFAAFTAEEVGGYGSRYFSQQLNPDEIVAMFNIEMIGKSDEKDINKAWITGFDKSDFGKLLQNAVEGTGYVFYADPYTDQNLFYRSDNATLARLGVPAHSISTGQIDTDNDYHQASDEVSTLNMEHMTNTIKAIAAAAERMISGKDTPTRVDPTSVN